MYLGIFHEGNYFFSSLYTNELFQMAFLDLCFNHYPSALVFVFFSTQFSDNLPSEFQTERRILFAAFMTTEFIAPRKPFSAKRTETLFSDLYSSVLFYHHVTQSGGRTFPSNVILPAFSRLMYCDFGTIVVQH